MHIVLIAPFIQRNHMTKTVIRSLQVFQRLAVLTVASLHTSKKRSLYMMLAPIKSTVKWLFAAAVLSLAAFAAVAIYTNVSVAVTAEDVQVFESLGLKKPNVSLTFEQQIALIRKVQYKVFKRAPLGKFIPDYQPREPADLMRYGQGQCFDRSRTFDKALSWLGMETRHVFLLYRENKSFFSAATKPGHRSHAVTEVKTSKGWMVVDSNYEWIALTPQGEPVNADDVWRRYSEFADAPEYFNRAWWAIRGMYSRGGKFYTPYVPFPEFNWVDFLSWSVERG
jgi:hypothetical protein